ncbi:MAG: Fe-S cluster assembly sulfur transfer protein SufU [Beutenbergiaceae bacterium]
MTAMAQLYQQLILDHSRERHGYGLGEDSAGTAESFQVNPTCGDEVRLRVRLAGTEDQARIDLLEWEGTGCSISQASISVMAQETTGATRADADAFARRFDDLMHSRGATLDPADEEFLGDAAAFAGVSKYPARVKCALLGWMALKDALRQLDQGE